MKRSDVPENIQNIIKKMLIIEPRDRMGFKEFLNLSEFQEKTIRHLKLNLSESNLAVSRSFVNSESYDDDYCLNRSPPEKEVYVAE